MPNYREIDQDPRWHQWLLRYSRRSLHSLSPNQAQLVRWGFRMPDVDSAHQQQRRA
jgi:hypothetical protein